MKLENTDFNPSSTVYLTNENKERIRQINDGDVIDLGIFNSDLFNIEVVVSDPTGHVESLVLDMKGPTNVEVVENLLPYHLQNRHYRSGDYTLSITPFCARDAQGTSGLTKTVSFQMTGEIPNNKFLPSIQWDRTLGGATTVDINPRILTLENGDVLIGGSAMSDEISISNRKGDYQIHRLDKHGNLIWHKTFEADGDDRVTDVVLLSDGNILLGGYSNSMRGPIKSEDSQGQYDYWVIKLDLQGNILWDKTFGGSANDHLRKLLALPNGEVLLGGISDSPASGDKTESGDQAWVIKINSQGEKVWDKNYDHNKERMPADIDMVLAPDGNYMFAVDVRSYGDIMVIKTNPDGDILWNTTLYDAYAGSAVLTEAKISILNDGNFLVHGVTWREGEVNKFFYIDTHGNIIREQSVTIPGLDFMIPLADGGFITAYTSGSKVKPNIKSEPSRGGRYWDDYYIIRRDKDGNRIWDKTLGGNRDDILSDMQLSPQGNLILAGSSESSKSDDKSEENLGPNGYPYQDYWIVQLDTNINRQNFKLNLWDAESDAFTQEIKPNESISSDVFSSDIQALEIKPSNGDIGSLKIELQGPVSETRTENTLPYSVFGKTFSTNLIGKALPIGEYSLQITPYTEDNLQGAQGETQVISFQVAGRQSFMLVDADTEQDIQFVFENDQIDLGEIGTNRFSIRYEPQTEQKPDRVVMQLTSESLNHEQTERLAPYALFGGEPITNYFGRNFCPGNYSIEAIEYLDGQVIASDAIQFQLVGGAQLDITELTLVDAQSNEDIAPLDTKIQANQQGYSIRADVGSCAKSVRFVLEDASGQVLIDQIESISPYALLGDAPRGDYIAWVPEAGLYTVKVTAYSEPKASGVAGVEKVIEFEVLEEQSSLIESSLINVYPNPSSENALVHMTFNVQWAGKAVLTVRDKQGYIQLQKDIYHKELDLNVNGLKPGFYIVNIQTANGSYNSTLIIN